MVTMCRTGNGIIKRYRVAYPAGGTIKLRPNLMYIGRGEIYSYNGIRYHGKELFDFYDTLSNFDFCLQYKILMMGK